MISVRERMVTLHIVTYDIGKREDGSITYDNFMISVSERMVALHIITYDIGKREDGSIRYHNFS